jgi:uncharacterized membrane protein YfcA
MTIEPLVLAALALVGMLAGFVDAIAGGGGLIALPALLAAGLPPVMALGTNKMQSVVGTLTATITYWRRGLIDIRALAVPILATYAGSLAGAFVVRLVDTGILRFAMPVVLIGVAAYFLFGRRLGDDDRAARLNGVVFIPVMGFLIGFYDGLFGPGTGTFFTIGFVGLFGFGLLRANASTKLLNLISNLGALTLFIPGGQVLWPVAIVMAIGQVVGGYLGALTGMRFGGRIIRPLVVVVSMGLAIKLLFFP